MGINFRNLLCRIKILFIIFIFISYDHPDVLAGFGTLGIEILEQLPTTNAIIAPVGGGGLIAGLAVAVKTLKPCTKIIVSWKVIKSML